MEQAMLGADGSVRALARAAMVRSHGESSMPWSEAQRAALAAFEPGLLSRA
jgi:hypothetical protein